MEKGYSLRACLKSLLQLTIEQVFLIFTKVMEAYNELDKQDRAHCRIKLENIML